MAGAGRGQLDREGEAVQPGAQRADRGGVVVRQGEARVDRGGALDEELDGGVSHNTAGRDRPGRFRDDEGSKRKLVLGPQAKRLTTGHEDAQSGATLDELGDRGGGVQDLLEVVEDEEEFAFLQGGAQRLLR